MHTHARMPSLPQVGAPGIVYFPSCCARARDSGYFSRESRGVLRLNYKSPLNFVQIRITSQFMVKYR